MTSRDREGEPFVRPAGRLLDRVLVDVGVERSDVYLTNAVKHFRFRREGGKTDPGEVAALPDLVVVATVHSSSVLRSDRRDAAHADLVVDLRVAAGAAADAPAA